MDAVTQSPRLLSPVQGQVATQSPGSWGKGLAATLGSPLSPTLPTQPPQAGLGGRWSWRPAQSASRPSPADRPFLEPTEPPDMHLNTWRPAPAARSQHSRPGRPPSSGWKKGQMGRGRQ